MPIINFIPSSVPHQSITRLDYKHSVHSVFFHFDNQEATSSGFALNCCCYFSFTKLEENSRIFYLLSKKGDY